MVLVGFMFFTVLTWAIFKRAFIIFAITPHLGNRYKSPAYFLDLLFMFLVVLNTVGSLPVLGTLLSVGLTVTPAGVAIHLTQCFRTQICLALSIATSGIYLGHVLSSVIDIELGPTILLIIGVMFILACVVKIAKPALILSRRYIYTGIISVNIAMMALAFSLHSAVDSRPSPGHNLKSGCSHCHKSPPST